MRRRAGEHRDRRRLLHPLFTAGRLAGGAERFRARPGQGHGRLVCRARHRRDRRADAACGDDPRRDRCLVHLQPRARHPTSGRTARAGGSSGRGRLCGDAARRGRLAPRPGEIARSRHRRALPAGRQTAQGRRQNAQPAARRHLAPDRARGPRSLLRRRGHARDRRPAEIAWRVARRRGLRRPALELGRADPRLLSGLRGL